MTAYGESRNLCREVRCDKPVMPPRLYCSKACGNTHRQREWRLRKAMRRSVETCSERDPKGTIALVESVVDRESYRLTLLECAAETRARDKHQIPYKIRTLGSYARSGDRIKGTLVRISSWVETDVMVDREIVAEKLYDEMCLSRWARKSKRTRITNIDKECLDDRDEETRGAFDSQHARDSTPIADESVVKLRAYISDESGLDAKALRVGDDARAIINYVGADAER